MISQTIYKPRISGMGGKYASHASFLSAAIHAGIRVRRDWDRLYIPAVIYASAITVDQNTNVTVEDSSDGVCLPPAGTFRADFSGQTGQITGSKIYWRSRKLQGDGTFEEWKKMGSGPTADPYEGNGPIMTSADAGVCQLEALLVLPNGSQVEFPYVRMRDARSIEDSTFTTNDLQQAGSPDFFGVTSNQISLDIRNKAVKWLGSVQYGFTKQIEVDFDNMFSPDMRNADKCNLFVTHTARSVGATTPYFIYKNGGYLQVFHSRRSHMMIGMATLGYICISVHLDGFMVIQIHRYNLEV